MSRRNWRQGKKKNLKIPEAFRVNEARYKYIPEEVKKKLGNPEEWK